MVRVIIHDVGEDGNILDGHTRSAIAAELGIDCPRIVKTGLTEHEKRIYSVEINLARRHATADQKAVAGRKIEADIAARAKARMALAGERSAPGKPATDVAPFVAARTTDEVARTVGLGSGRTYERQRQVIAQIEDEPDGEQLIANVERGDLTIRDPLPGA